jgi:imidazolonepropionase-like amidohydrolase
MRFCLGLFLVLLSVAIQEASAGPPTPSACSAFVDVTAVPMQGPEILAHQTVLIRGERIAEIGPTGHVKLPRDCVVIDGRNRLLIPGLTDAHVHFSGYSNTGLGDRSVQKSVLMLLLANGITTAINMEGSPTILTLREEIEKGKRLLKR